RVRAHLKLSREVMSVSVPASEEASTPTASGLMGGRVRSVARHASKLQFIRTSSWVCHMNDGLEQAFAAKKALARPPRPGATLRRRPRNPYPSAADYGFRARRLTVPRNDAGRLGSLEPTPR